jgi:hypothetical protein
VEKTKDPTSNGLPTVRKVDQWNQTKGLISRDKLSFGGSVCGLLSNQKPMSYSQRISRGNIGSATSCSDAAIAVASRFAPKSRQTASASSVLKPQRGINPKNIPTAVPSAMECEVSLSLTSRRPLSRSHSIGFIGVQFPGVKNVGEPSQFAWLFGHAKWGFLECKVGLLKCKAGTLRVLRARKEASETASVRAFAIRFN